MSDRTYKVERVLERADFDLNGKGEEAADQFEFRAHAGDDGVFEVIEQGGTWPRTRDANAIDGERTVALFFNEKRAHAYALEQRIARDASSLSTKEGLDYSRAFNELLVANAYDGQGLVMRLLAMLKEPSFATGPHVAAVVAASRDDFGEWMRDAHYWLRAQGRTPPKQLLAETADGSELS